MVRHDLTKETVLSLVQNTNSHGQTVGIFKDIFYAVVGHISQFTSTIFVG